MCETWGMSLSLLVTIVLMVLILAITVGLWARHHRARPVVGGIGWMLVPLGLYLFGITDLAVNGVLSIIDWAQRTVWGDAMTWGAALVGAGIVLAVVAQFLPKGPKPAQQAPQRPVAGAAGRPQVPGRPAAAKPQTGPAPAKSKDGLTDEDREIEELLRRRGIG